VLAALAGCTSRYVGKFTIQLNFTPATQSYNHCIDLQQLVNKPCNGNKACAILDLWQGPTWGDSYQYKDQATPMPSVTTIHFQYLQGGIDGT
jgi:hypothetical protein